MKLTQLFDKLECSCPDFEKQILPYKIAWLINWGRYFPYIQDYKPFEFCPWCGNLLRNREEEKI